MKTNVVFQKGKEKEKKKKRNKSRDAFPGKPLKPDALNLNWLGVIDLVFVTRVNR